MDRQRGVLNADRKGAIVMGALSAQRLLSGGWSVDTLHDRATVWVVAAQPTPGFQSDPLLRSKVTDTRLPIGQLRLIKLHVSKEVDDPKTHVTFDGKRLKRVSVEAFHGHRVHGIRAGGPAPFMHGN